MLPKRFHFIIINTSCLPRDRQLLDIAISDMIRRNTSVFVQTLIFFILSGGTTRSPENFKGGSVREGRRRKGHRFQRPPAERSEAPPSAWSEAPPSEAPPSETNEAAWRSSGGRHYKKTQKGSTRKPRGTTYYNIIKRIVTLNLSVRGEFRSSFFIKINYFCLGYIHHRQNVITTK